MIYKYLCAYCKCIAFPKVAIYSDSSWCSNCLGRLTSAMSKADPTNVPPTSDEINDFLWKLNHDQLDEADYE